MDIPKYIFITGASSGLGLSLAKILDLNNYKVIAGIRKESDRGLFQGTQIIPVICDVTKSNDINRVNEELKSITNGAGLAGLINNAGINYICPFELASTDRERDLLDVNLVGPMHLTRKLLPLQHEYVNVSGKKATIINISSIGGVFGLPWEAAYHASKFALLGWSQSIRFELEPLKINVCCFLPGGMKTNIFHKSYNENKVTIPSDHQFKKYYQVNLEHMYQTMGKFEKSAVAPEKAARVLLKVLQRNKAPLRIYFGGDAFFIRVLTNLGVAHFLKNQFIRRSY